MKRLVGFFLISTALYSSSVLAGASANDEKVKQLKARFQLAQPAKLDEVRGPMKCKYIAAAPAIFFETDVYIPADLSGRYLDGCGNWSRVQPVTSPVATLRSETSKQEEVEFSIEKKSSPRLLSDALSTATVRVSGQTAKTFLMELRGHFQKQPHDSFDASAILDEYPVNAWMDCSQISEEDMPKAGCCNIM